MAADGHTCSWSALGSGFSGRLTWSEEGGGLALARVNVDASAEVVALPWSRSEANGAQGQGARRGLCDETFTEPPHPPMALMKLVFIHL